MSLTNEEKIRRIATPHTLEFDVRHEGEYFLANYGQFGNIFEIPGIPIPDKNFRAINCIAHNKLKENGLFFRNNESDHDIFCRQFLNAENSFSETGNVYNCFHLAQTVDPETVYWRGNSRLSVNLNDVTIPVGNITGTTIYWYAKINNFIVDDAVALENYGPTQSLAIANGLDVIRFQYVDYFRAKFPVPHDVITDSGAVSSNCHIDVLYTIGNTAAGSVRALVPYRLQINGDFYFAGGQIYHTWGDIANFSGVDFSGTVDESTKTMTYEQINNNPNPPYNPDAVKTKVEMTMLPTINPGESYLNDGYISTTSVPLSLQYTSHRIHGYEDEELRFQGISGQPITTNVKVKPQYL